MPEDAACEGAGGSAVLPGDGSVHEDPVDALRVIVRVVLERERMGPEVRRTVPHSGEIEDDEVRRGPGPAEAAVREAETRCRHAGHLEDRFLEPQDALLDDEPLE